MGFDFMQWTEMPLGQAGYCAAVHAGYCRKSPAMPQKPAGDFVSPSPAKSVLPASANSSCSD